MTTAEADPASSLYLVDLGLDQLKLDESSLAQKDEKHESPSLFEFRHLVNV